MTEQLNWTEVDETVTNQNLFYIAVGRAMRYNWKSVHLKSNLIISNKVVNVNFPYYLAIYIYGFIGNTVKDKIFKHLNCMIVCNREKTQPNYSFVGNI